MPHYSQWKYQKKKCRQRWDSLNSLHLLKGNKEIYQQFYTDTFTILIMLAIEMKGTCYQNWHGMVKDSE